MPFDVHEADLRHLRGRLEEGDAIKGTSQPQGDQR